LSIGMVKTFKGMNMNVITKKLLPLLVAAALAPAAASAAVVESFDSGSLSAGWIGDAGFVSAAAAHDGAYGYVLDNSTWMYNTSVATNEGSKLDAWIRPHVASVGGPYAPDTGRLYLGFGAGATGTQSLVAATNTGDMRFQDNPGYEFVQLNASAQSWKNQWYRLEVDWRSDGAAVGNLYDADGTTLLNQVTQSGFSRHDGGVALRGFGGFDIDTVSVSPVPEPATYAMMLAGLGFFGFTARRKATTRKDAA
jgi:hypothetical protein